MHPIHPTITAALAREIRASREADAACDSLRHAARGTAGPSACTPAPSRPAAGGAPPARGRVSHTDIHTVPFHRDEEQRMTGTTTTTTPPT